MKVSIITSTLNSRKYIEACIGSVLNQTYRDIEYIIIDGGSSDGTLDVIKRYENKICRWISQKDNGVYDAMNKGLEIAKGDIVGFLNSDDIYASQDVIEKIVNCIKENNVDSCYGNVVYVDRDDIARVVRYWVSDDFSKDRFKFGWMPPHPSFFVKRSVYEEHGFFDTSFKIAADYEIMLRFLYKHGVSTCCIPQILVKMRNRGLSNKNIANIITANMECFRAWKKNNLKPRWFTVIFKVLFKIFQFKQFRDRI